MNRYDYWIFYIRPEMMDELAVMAEEESHIYAYTDNRDYANVFEKTHEMKYFVKKKFSFNQEEIHHLTLTERNRYLKMHLLTTRVGGVKKDVPIILTLDELCSCEAYIKDEVMRFSLHKTLINPGFLEEDYKRALETFRYPRFFAYQAGMIDGVPFDPETFHIRIDELAVYVGLFQNILK